MKNCFTVVLTVLSIFNVFGQSKEGKITGVVMDSKNNIELSFASVVVKDASNQIIDGLITDEEGKFKMEDVPFGTYTFEVEYMGFETYSNNITLDNTNKNIDLGTISLKEDAEALEGIIVEGEAAQVTLALDKKVFRVGRDILSQSGSVNDVLGNVPSITVEPSGAVSLRGNPNVVVLINGKRSGLASSDALEQLPSESVERVEVISNPSARYDANGSAGIINIILKKNKRNGLSGQVQLVGGIPQNSRINGSLNYKTEKFNFFSTLGVRSSDYVGLYTYEQSSLRDGAPIFIDQREDEDRHDDGFSGYFGVDYYLNDNNTFTLAFLRTDTKDIDKSDLRYDIFSNQTLDSTLVTKGNSEQKRDYNQLEFNYTKKFQKEGQQLTVDVQFDGWNSEKTTSIETSRQFPDLQDISNLRTLETRKVNDFVIQSDFVLPLKNEARIELGGKFEDRLVKTGFRAEELSDTDFQVIDGIDNDVDYNEKITAFYAQYKGNLKKIEYLIGLRYENTVIEIDDVSNVFNQKNIYDNLFPSASISYNISDKTQTQASYSKRINRPFLFFLNPFSELIDFNYRFSGNPNLNPAFADALELGLLYRGEKLTFNPSVYYSDTSDIIFFFTEQDENDVFVTRLDNLDNEKRYGVELISSYRFSKWLSIDSEFNFYGFEQKGIINSLDLGFSDSTWDTSLALRSKPINGMTIQARFNYEAPTNNAQTRTKSVSFFNAAISQTLFNGKGSIVLSGSNIFNTRKLRNQVSGNNFFINEVQNRNADRWTLSFLYKFNRKPGEQEKRANRSNRF